MGTENVLVRGPGPAYVELIAAGRDESNPWLDRVRGARGPISWAIAVDDIETARTSLVDAGFEPGPAVPGSRRTPDGDLLEWQVCDVGDGPYDGSLPFLIEWTTPMAPGPADGPVVEGFDLTPPDPDRVADLLVALGFVPSTHWPRRMFHEADSRLVVTLGPLGEAEDHDPASWSMSWEEPDQPRASIGVGVPSGELTRHTLDGVAVTTHPDQRRHAGAALLPAVDEVFARKRAGSSEPLLVVRAEAWLEAVVAARLGVATVLAPAAVVWREHHLAAERVTVLHGAPGTQPLTVALGGESGDQLARVVVGVGHPVEVLERQLEPASSEWVAHDLHRLDGAFVLALSGGVYAVREGPDKVVVRALDGWGSSGLFTDGEAQQWLAEATDGRRTDGVLRGDPWL